MALTKTQKIADFFLKESNPYSKKRAINTAHVGIVLAVLVAGVLGVGAYFDARAEKEHAIKAAQLEAERNSKMSADAVQSSNSQASSNQGFLSTPSFLGPFKNGGSQARQHSATQIIKRGDSASDVLPTGTLVRVKLVGQVESTDSQSPVTAVVIDDAKSPADFTVIPRGARLIGQGQLDASRERLQVRFSMIVYPEGEQFAISGLAAMTDGSSGIAGDFSSGSFKRHASQFVGDFVGGMADGLKDRTTGGSQIGIPFEPGSLKNGALNGVATSSLNYAKSTTEEMGQAGASITIPSGQEFVLYLEREFHQ